MANRYWVGGTGTWNTTSTTNWSTTSGTGSGASVPTAADSVFFDQAATYTVTMTGALLCLDITVSAGTVTFATGTSPTLAISGNMSLVSATVWNSTGALTFNATTTKTVSTNNVNIDAPINWNGVGGTWTFGSNFAYGKTAIRAMTLTNGTVNSANFTITSSFASTISCTTNTVAYQNMNTSLAMTVTSGTLTANGTFGNFTFTAGALTLGGALTTGTFTFTAGTLTLSSYTLTCTTMSATGATTRTFAYGTGNITCTGSGTVWTQATPGTLTVSGTPVVNVTNAGTTATTVTTGSVTAAQAVSFNFSGGAYALTFLNAASSAAISVSFSSGWAGSWGTATSTCTLYGGLTLSNAMTLTTSASAMTFGATSGSYNITSNGRTIPFPVTFNGVGGTWVLQDAMTLSNTLTTTLTNGTLNLNNFTLTTGLFSSSGSTARTLAFGTGNITCNGAGGTLWTTATPTSLTVTGTPVVNISYNGATATTVASGILTEAQAISFNFTIGTYSLTFLGTVNYSAKSVNFTGFTGTWAARTVASTIYGNITLSSGMTFAASSGILTLGSTSGTQTLTSNGITFDEPLTISVTGTVSLGDNFTLGSTRTLTHNTGTLDLNGKTLNVGTAYTTGTGTKNITFNGGTMVCPTASTTAFNNAVPTGFTTTAGTGTGTISMTAATAKTFVGGGSTYNCVLSNDGAGALTISGANTFTTIDNGVQPTSFVFTSSTTTTVSNFLINGTPGNLVTITSSTAGTAATLSKATGSVDAYFLSLRDSTATGGASWKAYTSTNVSGNTGWTFLTASGSFYVMFF